MTMSREMMVSIAERHRDAWAEELRYRLIGHIYDDVIQWMSMNCDDEAGEIDSSDEDFHQIMQIMEESIQLQLTPEEDIL